MIIKPKAPINVQIELTEACNHRCNHCYNYWRTDDFKGESPDIDRLVQIAHRVTEAEVFHAVLSGGEPLIIPAENLEQIISVFINSNTAVGINTNLTLTTPSHAELLKKYSIPILASLPGANEEEFDFVTNKKGSYKSFVKAAKMLSSQGVYLSANMVIESSRVNRVYDAAKFAKSLGFQGFNATRISPSNNGCFDCSKLLSVDDIISMLDQLLMVKQDLGMKIGSLNALPYCCVPDVKKYNDIFSRSCVAGLTTAGISPSGDMRACQHFDISYGNVLQEPLQDIWKRMPVWKMEYLNPDCKGCGYVVKCGGGCKENAMITAGKLDGDDSLKAGGYGKIGHPPKKELHNDEKIFLHSDLKIRDEEFGAVLYHSAARYAFIDHFTRFFILELSRLGEITKSNVLTLGEGRVKDSCVTAVFSNLLNARVAYGIPGRMSTQPCKDLNGTLYRIDPEQQEGGGMKW